ncbi:hypothetical protein HGM15179_018280 [Zosterops borbonicus]|uniref:Integrase catalytic domain-containing protein n=1 Tax=Zosterops borbonicus TaxID=364589 RepID=A0A8K1LCE1_9PASS|nr:hypothetical protein HGM15179_018280 [Zosterops borbonicus]
MGMGVNPWGLGSCEVWQTDITRIPSFGHLKYVHVSIDTYSGVMYASAHAGEKSVHAKQHLVQAFSVLGIPKEIKTDNGPAYVSKEFLEFVQQWGVERKTGIPHSPTGQAVVEHAHQTLKQVLARQSSSTAWMSSQQKLCKALFTINFLNCSFENESTSEKTYLTLNLVMNPIQVVILLMLNGLAAAWIVPQLHQNVWVTLAQTLQQENICFVHCSSKESYVHLSAIAFGILRCLIFKAINGLIPSTSEVNHIELANLKQSDFHTSCQDAIGLLGHLGILLAHVQLPLNQYPQVLFCLGAVQSLCPQPVALQGVVVGKMQDSALGLLNLHIAGLGPSIQPVQIPLQTPPTLQQIETCSQLGVICKFTTGGLNPLIQIINEYIKQN